MNMNTQKGFSNEGVYHFCPAGDTDAGIDSRIGEGTEISIKIPKNSGE